MDHSNKSSEQENTSNNASGDASESLQASGEEQNMSNSQSEEISSVASEDTASISHSGSNELKSGSSAESKKNTAAGDKIRGKGLMYDQGKKEWTVVSQDPNNPNIVVTSIHDRIMAGEKLEDIAGEDAEQVSDSEQQGKPKKPKLDHDDEACKTADDVLNKLQKKKDDGDDDTDSGNAGLSGKLEVK